MMADDDNEDAGDKRRSGMDATNEGGPPSAKRDKIDDVNVDVVPSLTYANLHGTAFAYFCHRFFFPTVRWQKDIHGNDSLGRD